MKRILVPTDFSPTSEKAFRFALEMASLSGGTIVLYHNYTPLETSFVGSASSRKENNKQTEIKLLKRLQRMNKKIAGDKYNVIVSCIVARSPLVSNMLRFAENNHVDIVVMGTQGASGIRRVLIGSVASRVVEKSKLPVLLIPARFEWREPEEFVFASNLEVTDRQALSFMLPLAKLFGAVISVAHLYGAYLSDSDKAKKKKGFELYARAIQNSFKGQKMKFYLIDVPSISEGMEELHRNITYDVAVMVRREKLFLEKFFIKSFTRKMAYISERPLLIIPQNK